MSIKDYAEGEPMEINWRKEDLRLICCKCGFVHRVRFAIAGHRLRLRMREDKEYNSNTRRR